jgi:hypothetical protein
MNQESDHFFYKKTKNLFLHMQKNYIFKKKIMKKLTNIEL